MKTVLIVDDNATDRDLLAKVVTASGHLAEFAADGEEALAKAKVSRPSLILLDVVMPKLDGFATCRKLKADAGTANIPVVLVTSKGQASDKMWGSRQGATDHVVKPYTPGQIGDVIKKYVA